MRVLGLGGSNHDLSAALYENGQITVYIEEERLNRRKHCLDIGMGAARALAVDYCLEAAGLQFNQIDIVACNDILTPLYGQRYRRHQKTYNHHLTHAASAFYTSGFEHAAVLVLDGYGSALPSGDGVETISILAADASGIRRLRCSGGPLSREGATPVFENSLGGLYLTVTRAVGFGFLEEGKTMGLSAYGLPRYVEELSNFFGFDGVALRFSAANEAALIKWISEELAGARGETELFQVKADFACAAQHWLQSIVLDLAREAKRLSGSSNLCIAGGVALNSVANWLVQRDSGFTNIFVPPFCHDAGTSIGAAYLAARECAPDTVKPTSPISAYLGREYSQDEIERTVAAFADQLIVTRPEDAFGEVARLLESGQIVGFFQGKSEAGPRSLGHRSILADPRRGEMKDIINRRIKHREPFRPFAPVVLAERQHRYFDCSVTSPYMLLIAPVRLEARHLIPAVTHADGTARLQTVTPNLSPELAILLHKFEELSGVGVLLNTSFNDNGEPIIETPADAIRCFLKIDLDALIVGPFVLRRRPQDQTQ